MVQELGAAVALEEVMELVWESFQESVHELGAAEASEEVLELFQESFQESVQELVWDLVCIWI